MPMAQERENAAEQACKISLVVPVYNTEKYLAYCLDSMLNQDLAESEYEIICVNDGATDGSPAILERYAQQHSCIQIINQENQGQSAARNVGLYSAKGKYVWFVDSDDLLEPNSLGFITRIMDENEIDELTVGLNYVAEDTVSVPSHGEYTYCPEKKLNLRATCSGVKIFRRSVIIDNGITWHSELRLSDDVLFLYQFELFSKKNVYVKSPQYHYRTVANSTSHQKSEAVLNKHMYSLVKLCEIYQGIRENPPIEMSRKQKRELDDRISLCVQTVLYDVAIKGDVQEQEEFLRGYKEKGLYPYKPIWSNLVPKISLQRTVYDFIMFFFINESLYKFSSKQLRKLYHKKNNKN